MQVFCWLESKAQINDKRVSLQFLHHFKLAENLSDAALVRE